MSGPDFRNVNVILLLPTFHPKKWAPNCVRDLGASKTPLTSHNFGWKENALRELLWNWNVFCYSTNMHVIIWVEPSRCVARGPKEQVPSDLLLPNQSISKGLWHLVACHTFGIYSSLTCFKSNGSKFGQAMGLEPPAPLVTSLGSQSSAWSADVFLLIFWVQVFSFPSHLGMIPLRHVMQVKINHLNGQKVEEVY